VTRIQYAVFGLLVAGGLTGALLLVPSQGDLALIHLKDKEFDIALTSYEQRLASGDRSPSVVVPLTDLYLQYGNLDRAIAVMKDLVDGDPQNLEALQRLGKFYQYAARLPDYLGVLERIAAIDPSEHNLTELAESYNFVAKYEKQITVLRDITRRYPANVRVFRDLATMEASVGHHAEAVSVLTRMQQLHPEEFDEDTAEFHLNLLLDLQRADDALALIVRMTRSRHEPDSLAYYSEVLTFRGFPDQALSLLAPYLETADSIPSLLLAVSRVRIAAGQADLAFSHLLGLYRDGKLPRELVEVFADQAIARQELDLAFASTERIRLDALPPWQQAALGNMAADQNRLPFLERLTAEAGPVLFKTRPVLGVRAALALEDTATAARWIDLAESQSLAVEDRLTLGGVYAALGRPEDELRSYEAVALSPTTADSALERLGELYFQQKRIQEGLKTFETLRGSRRAPGIEYRWALLAVTAGKGDEVTGWFAANASKLTAQQRTDLYFIAADAGHSELSLMAARAAFESSPTPASQMNLAYGLLKVDRSEEALPHLRVLRTTHSEAEPAYLEALNNARKSSAAAESELRDYWRGQLRNTSEANLDGLENAARALLDLGDDATTLPALRVLARTDPENWLAALADASTRTKTDNQFVTYLQTELDRPDLPQPLREVQTRLVLERGGSEQALPYLRPLASSSGSSEWISAYEEALQNLGMSDELVASWTQRALQPGTSQETRLQLAANLLQVGAKHEAEEVLLQSSAHSTPDSAPVAQLLFVWGPRPDSAALDWLETRGRESAGAERAGWMRHLTNLGSPERAFRLAPPQVEPGTDSAIVDASLEALISMDAVQELRRFAAQAIHSERGPERLRQLARLSRDRGLEDETRAAFTRLLTVSPTDKESLRELGAAALRDGDFARARVYLFDLMKSGRADLDSNLLFAELLDHDGDPAATAYFERALAQTETATGLPPQLQRAQVLQRLGRADEAFKTYEDLHVRYPESLDIVNEWAAALIRERRYQAARHILESDSDAEARDPQAVFRRTLLQAQAEAGMGRERAASELARGLAHQQPKETQPLLLLASLADKAGQWRRANSLYREALRLQPRNEDLLREVHRIQRPHTSSATASVETRRVGAALETRSTAALTFWNTSGLHGGLTLQRAALPSFRRTAVEAFVAKDFEGGDRLSLSLTGNSRQPGSSVRWTTAGIRGSFQFGADFRKPFWDLPESIEKFATQDRLLVGRTQQFGNTVTGRFTASANRFHLNGVPAVRTLAVTGTLAASRQWHRASADFQYIFDKERQKSGPSAATFPKLEREVHSGIVTAGLALGADGRLFANGGWSWDRLGGMGPSWGARAQKNIGRFSVEAWFESSRNSLQSGQAIRRVGVQIGFIRQPLAVRR
jgi:Tfp pilus assembly protein PilF